MSLDAGGSERSYEEKLAEASAAPPSSELMRDVVPRPARDDTPPCRPVPALVFVVGRMSDGRDADAVDVDAVAAQVADGAIERTWENVKRASTVLGLYTLLSESLAVPFQTVVLGVEVTVEDIDLSDRGEIVAHCTRGGLQQQIGVLDLPLPQPPPDGAEWIEAYRRWTR
jgi:hypothetical protein